MVLFHSTIVPDVDALIFACCGHSAWRRPPWRDHSDTLSPERAQYRTTERFIVICHCTFLSWRDRAIGRTEPCLAGGWSPSGPSSDLRRRSNRPPLQRTHNGLQMRDRSTLGGGPYRVFLKQVAKAVTGASASSTRLPQNTGPNRVARWPSMRWRWLRACCLSRSRSDSRAERANSKGRGGHLHSDSRPSRR